MIRAHQPGSQPIDIPEVIPNPAVVPKQEPAPKEPAPKEPVKVPEKVPAGYAPLTPGRLFDIFRASRFARLGHPMTALGTSRLFPAVHPEQTFLRRCGINADDPTPDPDGPWFMPTPRPASRRLPHWTKAGYRVGNGYRPPLPS